MKNPDNASAEASLHAQRSSGAVKLHYSSDGVQRFREEGAFKLRLPHGSNEAILINTSGGLAGGDSQKTEISTSGHLTVTTQAAERVYRSLGPDALIENNLRVETGGQLFWLPQETILFNGGRLKRALNVQLDAGSTFVAIESVVFGRSAMGESLSEFSLQDKWDVNCAGKLVHAERLVMGPTLPQSTACLGDATSMATLLAIAPDVSTVAERIMSVLPEFSGITCWNGKLIARFLSKDAYALKKALGKALVAGWGISAVPKAWAL